MADGASNNDTMAATLSELVDQFVREDRGWCIDHIVHLCAIRIINPFDAQPEQLERALVDAAYELQGVREDLTSLGDADKDEERIEGQAEQEEEEERRFRDIAAELASELTGQEHDDIAAACLPGAGALTKVRMLPSGRILHALTPNQLIGHASLCPPRPRLLPRPHCSSTPLLPQSTLTWLLLVRHLSLLISCLLVFLLTPRPGAKHRANPYRVFLLSPSRFVRPPDPFHLLIRSLLNLSLDRRSICAFLTTQPADSLAVLAHLPRDSLMPQLAWDRSLTLRWLARCPWRSAGHLGLGSCCCCVACGCVACGMLPDMLSLPPSRRVRRFLPDNPLLVLLVSPCSLSRRIIDIQIAYPARRSCRLCTLPHGSVSCCHRMTLTPHAATARHSLHGVDALHCRRKHPPTSAVPIFHTGESLSPPMRLSHADIEQRSRRITPPACQPFHGVNTPHRRRATSANSGLHCLHRARWPYHFSRMRGWLVRILHNNHCPLIDSSAKLRSAAWSTKSAGQSLSCCQHSRRTAPRPISRSARYLSIAGPAGHQPTTCFAWPSHTGQCLTDVRRSNAWASHIRARQQRVAYPP